MISKEHDRKLLDGRKRWWEGLSQEERQWYKDNLSKKLKGRAKPADSVAKRRTGIILPCESCGKEVRRVPYQLKRQEHVFCSKDCFYKWQRRPRKPHLEVCLNCGREFNRVPSRAKYNQGHHYCSRECAVKCRCGQNHPNWAGGRRTRADGYIDICQALVPDKFRSMVRAEHRVLEHRLIMAQHLGRCLKGHEVVHHLNGIRDDNRLENLELHPKFDHDGMTTITSAEVNRLMTENKRLRKIIKELRLNAPA